MIQEISQFDIPNRLLLATGGQPARCRWTDIGEAKITHTIFGRARVCVIHEHEQKRRRMLLAALAVTALMAAAWQGLIVWQQIESAQNAAPLPESARIRVSAPIFQPEYTPPPAAPAPPRIVAPQQAPVQPIAVKPVAAPPVSATRPPLAASNAAKIQTDLPPPALLAAPIQPAAPTAPAAAAILPATPPAVKAVVTAKPAAQPAEKTSPPADASQALPSDDAQP